MNKMKDKFFKGFSSFQIAIVIVVTLFFGLSCISQGIATVITGFVIGFALSYLLIVRYNRKKDFTPEQRVELEKARLKEKTELKTAKLKSKEQIEKHKAKIASYKQKQKFANIDKLVCPKCGSANVKPLQADKKGFSWGKAAGGTLLSGRVGTLAGYTGKETGKTVFVCLNCGKQFKK